MTNSLSYYQSSTGKWRHLTDIPHVEQCNFGLAVLQNELYVIGGCVSQSLQETMHPFGFRYNPRKNTWTSIAPMLVERSRYVQQLAGVYATINNPPGGIYSRRCLFKRFFKISISVSTWA